MTAADSIKFAKSIFMTEFKTNFNENDFRPYQSEFSTFKNIAFVPSNAGVNLDL